MWPSLFAESVSRNPCLEWDAVSTCGPVGKPHPTSTTNSGSHFPPSPSTGNHIPFPGKFWDALSESPSIRKARPTLNTSSERMRACRPGRSRHRGDGKCHPKRLPSLHPRVSRKSLENLEAFTFVRLNARHRERRSYSPSTAFLAAAAMLSRSSLVGWSFAATQLSSSILNRALSGSCSSMAS